MVYSIANWFLLVYWLLTSVASFLLTLENNLFSFIKKTCPLIYVLNFKQSKFIPRDMIQAGVWVHVLRSFLLYTHTVVQIYTKSGKSLSLKQQSKSQIKWQVAASKTTIFHTQHRKHHSRMCCCYLSFSRNFSFHSLALSHFHYSVFFFFQLSM